MPSNRPLQHFLDHPENHLKITQKPQIASKIAPKLSQKSKKNVYSKASWEDLSQPLPKQTTQPSPGESLKSSQRISSKCPTNPQQTHNEFLKKQTPNITKINTLAGPVGKLE